MMERNFYNDDDFEELLKHKADQFKMYPSDKVWKEVYSSLHTRRRNFFIGMSLLVSGILFFAGRELLVPAKHDSLVLAAKSLHNNAGNSSGSTTAEDTQSTVDLSPFKEAGHISAHRQKHSDYISFNQNINEEDLTDPATADSTSSELAFTDKMADSSVASSSIASTNGNGYALSSANKELPVLRKIAVLQTISTQTDLDEITAPTIEASAKKEPETIDEKDKKEPGWVKEYAAQPLQMITREKLSWQFYFSPTVNYRKLSGADNTNFKNLQNVPIASVHEGDPNNFVDHTPATGFQVGGAFLYTLTRNLVWKAGLQFNYSRYTIRAYSNLVPDRATIALSQPGYSGNSTNAITSYTAIRNFGGIARQDLQNQYFQMSVPMGLELRVIGNGKLQLHVGATVEPTYLFNRNSYLLTADYTNYTKAPSLFRHWNLNGGIEAFMSLQTGKLRWQIGPQFRYQLFSTYTDQYPLRENLMGYGFKIGISKAIR